MTFDDYIGQADHNLKKCIVIMRAKAKDYAKMTDPFANFRACEQFGIPLERGILVRISDKISRINNLFEKEADVKDESIEDTIRDAINYLNIIHIYLKEKKNDDSRKLSNSSSNKSEGESKGEEENCDQKQRGSEAFEYILQY